MNIEDELNGMDEYPCIDCGEMVDVEEYCNNNGHCKKCLNTPHK